MKINYILTHPIQYQAPLIRFLHKSGINLKVLYRSNLSSKKYFDKEFNRNISWGTNLLSGYNYKFLNYIGSNKVNFLFPLTTDFINKVLDDNVEIIWVHGIKNWYNICIIILAKIFNKKVFVRDEVTHFSKKRNFLNKFVNFLFYNLIDYFVDIYLAIGSQNKKYYLDHNINPKKIVMVPYVVDNNFFYKKNKNNSKSIKFTYLFAAKLIKKKGAILLLEAVKILQKNITFTKNSNFLITGDGYLKNSLKEYSKKNNLNNVKFIPFQNQKQISKIYQKADVFVIPSLIEPWGLAVNEAMAAENAIISSTIVGSSFDLVFNGLNGFKFKSGCSKDLAKKILLMYQNKRKIKKYKTNSVKIISKWNFDLCLKGFQKGIKKVKN